MSQIESWYVAGKFKKYHNGHSIAIRYTLDTMYLLTYLHENAGQKKKGNVASRVPASLSYVSAHQPSYVE